MMTGLSGNLSEHSVVLNVVNGGLAKAWFDGTWWGASQAFAPEIAQAMLISGHTLGTEHYFAAFDEDSGMPIPGGTNIDPPPTDATFGAFIAAVGLARVDQGGIA
jgi:hypothetical protein